MAVYIFISEKTTIEKCCVQFSIVGCVVPIVFVAVFIILCFYGAGCCAISAVVHAFY